MGLFQKWLLGVDLDAEQAASDTADAKIRALNQSAVDRGVWTPDQRNAADSRLESAPVTDQVAQDFQTGWNEGAANVAKATEKVISGVAGTAADVVSAPLLGVLRGLPWWLWIAGGLAAAAYFGLLPGLLAGVRGALKKA